MGNTVKGVGVDKGAVSKHDPVTVLVTPDGHDIDADTWSDANNLIAAGCAVKEGYPSAPGEEPTGKAKASGSSSAQQSSSTSSAGN